MGESTKIERRLELNNFSTTGHLVGLKTLAYLIRTLLLIEPGTYPNNPEMGVGIETFKFEILDDRTLSRLRTKINNQLSRHLPDYSDLVDLIEVKKIEEPIGNSLGILIKLRKPIDNADGMIIKINETTNNNKELEIFI